MTILNNLMENQLLKITRTFDPVPVELRKNKMIPGDITEGLPNYNLISKIKLCSNFGNKSIK